MKFPSLRMICIEYGKPCPLNNGSLNSSVLRIFYVADKEYLNVARSELSINWENC